MKIDERLILKLEQENDATSLYRLQKEKQYLYVKVRTFSPEKIFTKSIPLLNGNTYIVKLVKNEDLEELKIDKRFRNKPITKRKLRGRKFAFCVGCEHEKDCSTDVACDKRDAVFAKKEKIKQVKGDIRYWENGSPKKHLILCKYAKYLYAHKKTAGQCQKDKCAFFSCGECELHYDIKKYGEEKVSIKENVEMKAKDQLKTVEKVGMVDNITLPQEPPQKSVDVEYLVKSLNDLDKSLTEIEKSKNDELNIFYATGMTTQEIKHSAFLAWLMSPKQTHNLGNMFLSRLLQQLFLGVKTENDVKNNAKILTECSFSSFADLKGFLAAKDINVETEKIVNDSEGRIDVFIQSVSAEVTIVIENKIFTSVHDNQLNNYEKACEKYKGKKIYIYLTPQGDIPIDIDGNYEQQWCILSYKEISETIKSILTESDKKKGNNKLIFLMEDYLKMLDTHVLKTNEKLRSLCKQIRKKHADALELLMNYTDNTESVIDFSYNWLTENIPNIAKLYRKDKVLCGYTSDIENFYLKKGYEINITESWYKFQFQLECDARGYTKIMMGVGKQPNEEWLQPDIAIQQILMPNKKMNTKYCTLYTLELLSTEEFSETMKEIIPKLSARLSEFGEKLKYLENCLNKLN